MEISLIEFHARDTKLDRFLAKSEQIQGNMVSYIYYVEMLNRKTCWNQKIWTFHNKFLVEKTEVPNLVSANLKLHNKFYHNLRKVPIYYFLLIFDITGA